MVPALCGVLSHFSRVRLCATLQTVAPQAPLSMGFSSQEYWGGLPFPSPGDLPDPGIEPVSLMSPELAGRFFTTSTTWEALGPCIGHIQLRTQSPQVGRGKVRSSGLSLPRSPLFLVSHKCSELRTLGGKLFVQHTEEVPTTSLCNRPFSHGSLGGQRRPIGKNLCLPS